MSAAIRYRWDSLLGETFNLHVSGRALEDFKEAHGLVSTRRMILARIRSQLYLLGAMWRGEGEFLAWDLNGRICLVASMTGSLFEGGTIVRVFYSH